VSQISTADSNLCVPEDPLKYFLKNRGFCFKLERDDTSNFVKNLSNLGFIEGVDYEVDRREWEEGIIFFHPYQVMRACLRDLEHVPKKHFLFEYLGVCVEKLKNATPKRGLPQFTLVDYQMPVHFKMEDLLEDVFKKKGVQGLCIFGGTNLKDATVVLDELLLNCPKITTLFFPFLPICLQEKMDDPTQSSPLLKAYFSFMKKNHGDFSLLISRARRDGVRIVGLGIKEWVIGRDYYPLNPSEIKSIETAQDAMAQVVIANAVGKFIVLSEGNIFNSFMTTAGGVDRLPKYQGVPFAPLGLI
jgi:hypothetical protein